MMLELKSSQVVIPLLCLSELFVIGLLVFSHGFLLTRQVIALNSTCNDFSLHTSDDGEISQHMKDLAAENGCWMKPSYNKAVILIIDALRYDFAYYNASLKKDERRPYLNKMPVFRDIIEKSPEKALLMPFIADAPTTTMQRLKGLTTGSLPTFIDASHNFASEEISEDNIIDQLVKNGKQLTILGDDTWGGLFPKRFKRSHLYPSFNVMDLHTVDNGILEHLDAELQKGDWDLLISHFLGVDHCGHRYGPNHPEMTAKLTQMNNVVKNVAESIGNDTLLLVFGDHGMTKTGDHGGDSEDEVMAALFMYSPGLKTAHTKPRTSYLEQVSQVDIVPSLALALGVPIPYSNLGKVVPDVLATQSPEDNLQKKVLASALNVKQVKRYLHEYKAVGNEFPQELWSRLEDLNMKMDKGLKDLTLREEKNIYFDYLSGAKIMCEEIWAKFNVVEMTSGLVLMFMVMVLTVFMVISEVYDPLLLKRLLFLTIGCNTLFVLIPFISLALIGCMLSGMIALWIYFHKIFFSFKNLNINNTDVISLILVIFSYIGSFSNSYVVVENYVIAFILMSLVTILSMTCLIKRQKKKTAYSLSWKNIKAYFNFRNVVCCVAFCVLLVSVRVSSRYWKCREEQAWCVPSQVHTPMTGLPENLRNWRYFTSIFALVLLVWLPRRWLTMCGNLNGSRLGVILVNYVPVITCVLVASHWALQAAPLQNSPLIDHIVIPPRLTYALTFIFSVALFFLPLMIYEVPSKKNLATSDSNPYGFVPQVYHKLVEKYHGDNSRSPSIPIVYGLATALSAPLLSLLTAVLVVMTMVASDGLTPAIIILVISAASCLLVQAASAWTTTNSIESLMKPSWLALCVWFALSLHGFYITGHQHTFPSLQWSAAFVGFAGDWGGSNIFPALLVGFNTYMAHIIFALALPLVLIAPLGIGVVFPRVRGNRLETEEASRGEFLLVDRPEKAREAVLFTAVSYTLLHAAKVFCSALSAFILRRHLMVWKIFAPHFIFEAVGFIVTSGSVVLGSVFLLRVLDVLYKWSEVLHLKNS